jgi:hypothetical protein
MDERLFGSKQRLENMRTSRNRADTNADSSADSNADTKANTKADIKANTTADVGGIMQD